MMYAIQNVFGATAMTSLVGELTSIVDSLGTSAVTVIGAALALAGGVLIVRIGFKWLKQFLSGA